jgi:hypothetical protein
MMNALSNFISFRRHLKIFFSNSKTSFQFHRQFPRTNVSWLTFRWISDYEINDSNSIFGEAIFSQMKCAPTKYDIEIFILYPKSHLLFHI